MGTATSTTSIQFDDWIKDAQKKMVSGAAKGMEPFLSDPGTNVAPLREEYGLLNDAARQALASQSSNSGLLSSLLQQSANSNRSGQLNGLEDYAAGANFGGAASGLMDVNSQVSFAPQLSNMVGSGERTIPIASSYAQTDANEALALANPWAEARAEQVIGGIDDAHEKSANAIAGQAARRSGFGGSAEAIAMSQLDNNRSKQTEEALTGILNDSYNVGAQLASQNMASRNGSLDRTVNAMFNSTGQDLNALNSADGSMNSYNNRNQSNIGLMDSLANNYIGRNTGVANAQDGLDSSYFNRNLQGIGAKDQFDSSALARQAQSMGLVGSIADKHQNHDQQLADQDYSTYSRLAGIIPNVAGQQVTTEPTNDTGFLGTMLGLGGMLLGV